MSSFALKFKEFFSPEMPEGMDRKALQKDVVDIAWPAVTELVLVQLCSIIDTAMVGRLGSSELASVGYCTQPKFLLLAVFIALNSGATALIARMKGAEDREGANRVFRQSIGLTLFLSLIISVIGYVFSEEMVVFMGAEGQKSVTNATRYMQIQMLGFVFNAITLSITAGLRGIGQTKVSMYYNLAANGLNVLFNYMFIYGRLGAPRLEVAGASFATVLGQTIAFIIAVCVIARRSSYLNARLREIFFFDFTTVKRIVNIGLPAMLEQFVLRAGLILYTRVVTSLGEVQYAAHLIGINIMSLSFMNGQAFGIAATSLLGQSMGKGRIDLAKAYTYECRRLGMFISILLGVGFVAFGEQLVMLFNTESEVVRLGKYILIVVAINQPIQASQLILSGALRGAGDTRTMAISTFIGMLLIRPATSYMAVNILGFGLVGAWVAVILDQLVRSVIAIVVFAREKWVKIVV